MHAQAHILFSQEPAPYLHLFLIAAVIMPGRALSASGSSTLVTFMCTKAPEEATEGADIMDKLGFNEGAMQVMG